MTDRMRASTAFARLSLVVVLLLLSACAGGGAPAATSVPPNTSAPTTGAPATTATGTGGTGGTSATSAPSGAVQPLPEPVTIEVFTPVRSVELPPPDENWIVAKKVKEALNIDLKMSWQTDLNEYERLVMTRGAANDLPDLFSSSINLGRDLGQQGLLADWTQLFPSMPTYVKDREVERLAPIGTFDGKLYTLTSRTADPFKQSVAIRQDWLDKLGLQTPKTLEEYLEVMKAFAQKDPDGNGQADTYGWSTAVDSTGLLIYFDPIFGAFGALGDWRIDGSNLVYVPTSPERLQALQFINRMSQEGALDPDWSSQKGTDRGNKWKAGKVGMFQEDWCAAFCKGNFDPFAQANPTGRLVDIAPPVGPNGQSALGTYSISGPKFSVSQRAIDQGKGEAIARLMEWLNTDGYYLVAFGEEGVNWTREGEKIVQIQDDPSKIARAWTWANKGSEAELRARYDQTTLQANGQEIAVWEIEQRAQDYPKVDVTQFAALPPAPVDKAADLQRLRAEGELQFVTGQRPFTEWDAYVQSLRDAGLEQWQAEAEQRARELGILK
ncbi:MAG TPA: extracellular solute-binding protein [Roseiflexaceae bacterium]|nr:extracellular solute-binding protein [Roseiflexaceae bacterium]